MSRARSRAVLKSVAQPWWLEFSASQRAYDLLLSGGQLGRSPRHGPRRQTVDTLSSEVGDPAVDGAVLGWTLKMTATFFARVSLIDSLHGELTTILENDRCA
jgi:hypothetical protein